MPTVTAQKMGADTLERGRRLVLDVSGNGAGTLQRLYGSPAAIVETITLYAGAQRSFGEYDVDMQFRVYCLAGTITYKKVQSLSQRSTGSGGTPINGTEDVPGLDPVLTDLDMRVLALRAVLTGINGGTPTTDFSGVVGVSGGTP